MRVLEMRAASSARHGNVLVPPVTLVLEEGKCRAFACETDRAAAVLALMAAGVVRPTSGTLFIGAFDPRIQPVQSKRIAGYVPHEAVANEFGSFGEYIDYRAALWGLPRAQAAVRANALLAVLDGVHEAFAYPLVGALLAAPRLLVLDRPQAVHAAQIMAAARDCTIFSTHASEREAARFAEQTAVRA
jgi:hypothetical protein